MCVDAKPRKKSIYIQLTWRNRPSEASDEELARRIRRLHGIVPEGRQ